MPDPRDHSGTATGGVRTLLRLEGAGWFLLGTSLYVASGGSWWLFLLLVLVPDLSLLAYLAGPRIGAALYNLVHSTIGPIVLAALGFFGDDPLLLRIALVWIAHIGADRALGLGLKYPAGFGHTHLGRIGGRSDAQ